MSIDLFVCNSTSSKYYVRLELYLILIESLVLFFLQTCYIFFSPRTSHRLPVAVCERIALNWFVLFGFLCYRCTYMFVFLSAHFCTANIARREITRGFTSSCAHKIRKTTRCRRRTTTGAITGSVVRFRGDRLAPEAASRRKNLVGYPRIEPPLTSRTETYGARRTGPRQEDGRYRVRSCA